MNNYFGTIIEESLDDKSVLKKVKVISTLVEKVNDKHKTPWLKKWTLHKVEVPEASAEETAAAISHSMDKKHAWYADFRNQTHHYIIFLNKIFFVDRDSQKQYDAAKDYGLALGIPTYQVDFHPDVKHWEDRY